MGERIKRGFSALFPLFYDISSYFSISISEYKDTAIDKSYWYLYEKERSKLHPDDRENPIWNEEAKNNS